MQIKYKIRIGGLILSLLLGYSGMAQEGMPTSDVKTIGRYISNQGIELRIFPDRKSTLELGLTDGFYIERSDANSNAFTVIDTVKPFSDDEWENILNINSDNQQLELAKDFYDNIGNKSGGNLNFEEGISSLKQQKAVEDFEFMIFILTAIKDENSAQALGLRYVDSTVLDGANYTYRIGLVSSNNKDFWRPA